MELYIYIMEGVSDLTENLKTIIDGQQDDTVSPEIAEAAAIASANTLFKNVYGLISNRKKASSTRQKQRAVAAAAEMSAVQRESELAEDLEMMNDVNRMLANSNGRLNRAQRIKLHKLIMKTISNTITNDEIKRELEANGSQAQQNIRDLFNALITYYTEMASYGYERAPDILANIGSIVAGTAIIGSTILTPQVGTEGGMLMTLASFIGPITATASGLYFLQRGGLPVQPMLRSLGANTIECVKAGCVALQQKIGNIYDAGINSLSTYLNPDMSQFAIGWDARSGNFSVAPSRAPSRAPSVAASTASTTSTAGEAAAEIYTILNVSDVVREEEVINGITAPSNSIVSSPMFPGAASAALPIPGSVEIPTRNKREKRDLSEAFYSEDVNASQGEMSALTEDGFGSQRGFDSEEDEEEEEKILPEKKRLRPLSPLVEEDVQEEEVGDAVMGEDDKNGGRKSRRNTKSRKSRKGRKGRKGRMTKKGRKHHKTLKRYRSKMRR